MIQPVPLYEQTHSVMKKHHKKINKKGNQIIIVFLVLWLSGFSRVLLWRQGEVVISARTWEGTSLETVRQWPVSQSSLYISSLELSHTGNYSCVSDQVSQTVLLVVSSGQAEMSLNGAVIYSYFQV